MIRIILLLIIGALGSCFYQNCTTMSPCGSSQYAEFDKSVSDHENLAFEVTGEMLDDTDEDQLADRYEAANQCQLKYDADGKPVTAEQVAEADKQPWDQ